MVLKRWRLYSQWSTVRDAYGCICILNFWLTPTHIGVTVFNFALEYSRRAFRESFTKPAAESRWSKWTA